VNGAHGAGKTWPVLEKDDSVEAMRTAFEHQLKSAMYRSAPDNAGDLASQLAPPLTRGVSGGSCSTALPPT